MQCIRKRKARRLRNSIKSLVYLHANTLPTDYDRSRTSSNGTSSGGKSSLNSFTRQKSPHQVIWDKRTLYDRI